ncbi:MAG: hypothetical protein GY757_23905 [bacterium]|nr:hypothetical protein [bacterium]
MKIRLCLVDKKQLLLNKKTIAHLDAKELNTVQGGRRRHIVYDGPISIECTTNCD